MALAHHVWTVMRGAKVMNAVAVTVPARTADLPADLPHDLDVRIADLDVRDARTVDRVVDFPHVVDLHHEHVLQAIHVVDFLRDCVVPAVRSPRSFFFQHHAAHHTDLRHRSIDHLVRYGAARPRKELHRHVHYSTH